MNETDRHPSNRTPVWRRALKAIAWTAIIAVVTFVTVCSAIVWFLTPERLTPIIERVASDNLNAKVSVGRAELTFWSTFPNLRVNVDQLEIVSHALDGLTASQRAALPANADSLLSVGQFSGSINVSKILAGKIALNNVIIDAPRINMIQVNDTVANFNILPPTDPDKPKSPIPNISIHHFAITNARPITYKSLSDSLNIDVKLHTIDLSDKGLPLYRLTLDTNFDSPVMRQYNLHDIRLNLDGDINWDGNDPYRVMLDNLVVKLDKIDVKVNTAIDFRDDLRLDLLDVKVNRLDVNSLIDHAPDSLREQLSGIETDMTATLDLRLIEPFVVKGDGRLPIVSARVDIPDCSIDWRGVKINKFATDLTITTGAEADLSTVDIARLAVHGPAIDIDVDGTVTTPVSAPTIDGNIKLDIDLKRLNPRLKAMIPGKLTGHIMSDTKVRVNLNDIKQKQFYRLYADGNITLDRLDYCSADSLTQLFANRGKISLGTRRSIATRYHNRVDSMLLIELTADTAHIKNHTHLIDLKDFNGTFASLNTMSSADTTHINPFGGRVSLASMHYHSTHDSLTMAIRDIGGIATFSAYNGDLRRPQIGLDVDMKRMKMNSSEFVSVIRESHLTMTTHLRERHRRNADRDSAQVTRPRRPRALTTDQLDSLGVDIVDFNVDNTLRTMLTNWETTAHITARRGRAQTSRFPLRLRLSNLDATFEGDSAALNSVNIKIGRSDISASGSIAGIRGAINRRRPRPLRLHFDISSDTLHINQLVQAAVKHTGTDEDDDKWDDLEVEKLNRDIVTDSVIGAILIPVNIDAELNLSANNVIYSDMDMQQFSGTVLIDRGVLQLSDIKARTTAGGVRLSALYSAPTDKDMNVGVGMVLENIHLGKLHSLLPGLNEVIPMLASFSGNVTAKVAATVDLTPEMDMRMSTLRAALTLRGDSLEVVDDKAMRTAAKWLLFHNKRITHIDSLNVNVVVRDNFVQVYPFMVNVDRYRLGIMGHSNLGSNLDYHVAVLKSPVPFKFGINIKGSLEKPKIRFGGAKLKPEMIVRRDAIADTIRINLVNEMNSFFRRSIRAARLGRLDIKADTLPTLPDAPPVVSPADSLMLIEAGLIEVPDSIVNHLRLVTDPQTPTSNDNQ